MEFLRKANIKLFPGSYQFAPEWMVLGVNNVCNLHCKMCDVGLANSDTNFYTNLVGTKPLHMPLELIKDIMDQAAKYYPNTKMGYAFTEPLVYKYLAESLEHAKKHGLYTSITTNALTLRQKADMLCENGLSELFISLDGPPAIHNEIRGHKSSFEKAIEGMETLFSKSKRPEISVFCVITEWNIGHLREFAEIFKDMPIKHMGFMHTNFTTEEQAEKHNARFGQWYHATPSNLGEINVEAMDLDLLWEEIKALKSSSYKFPITFSPEVDSRQQLEVFYYHPEILLGKHCNDVFRNIMIKSDGSVIPAHGRCYNLNIGNIYEQSLKEIWNSGILSKFRQRIEKEGGLFPACSRCCSAF